MGSPLTYAERLSPPVKRALASAFRGNNVAVVVMTSQTAQKVSKDIRAFLDHCGTWYRCKDGTFFTFDAPDGSGSPGTLKVAISEMEFRGIKAVYRVEDRIF